MWIRILLLSLKKSLSSMIKFISTFWNNTWVDLVMDLSLQIRYMINNKFLRNSSNSCKKEILCVIQKKLPETIYLVKPAMETLCAIIWCYFFIAELDFMGSFNGTNNEIRKGIPEKKEWGPPREPEETGIKGGPYHWGSYHLRPQSLGTFKRTL